MFPLEKAVQPALLSFLIPDALPAPKVPAFPPDKAAPPVLASLPFPYPECREQMTAAGSEYFPDRFAPVSRDFRNPARCLHLHRHHLPTLQFHVLLHRKAQSIPPDAGSAPPTVAPEPGFPACVFHSPQHTLHIPEFPVPGPQSFPCQAGPRGFPVPVGLSAMFPPACPPLFHTVSQVPASSLIPLSSVLLPVEILHRHRMKEHSAPADGHFSDGPDSH